MNVNSYRLCNRCQLKKSKKDVRCALYVNCTVWCSLGKVHLATVGISRKHTKSKKTAPFGAVHQKCTIGYTADPYTKNILSFVVFCV